MNIYLERIIKFFRRERKKISLVALVILVILIVLFMKGRMDSLRLLRELSIGDVFLLFFAGVLFKIALGFNFKVLVSFFGIYLPFREWFGLTCIAAMTNYLLPGKAGMAAQAVYLKNKFSFRYTNFLSSITGFYAATFLVNSVIGGALGVRIFLSGEPAGKGIFVFFLAVAILSIALIFLIINFPRLSSRGGIFRDFFEGFRNFHNKPEETWGLVISQLIVILAVGFRLFVAFRSLGINIDLVSSTTVALITSFSIFINLTPGSLGIKEFLITFSSSILGVDPSSAMVVAMLDRVVDIGVSFIVGYVFVFLLGIGDFRFRKDRA